MEVGRDNGFTEARDEGRLALADVGREAEVRGRDRAEEGRPGGGLGSTRLGF